MLLRPDSTYISPVLKRAELVFPQGTDWLRFESALPGKEVFANSVLDPAIGLAGDLALQTFAAADWQNWISTAKVSLFEIGTRIGLPPIEGTSLASGVASVYSNIEKSVSALQQFQNPSELVPELLKNAGLQILQQLAGTNMIAATVAQVLAAAMWAIDVVATHKHDELAKDVALPPLQTEDPATDTWQVNRVYEVFRRKGVGGIVYPDGGIEPASNADYTNFFLPAYRSTEPWAVQHRASGIAAQQGPATEARGPSGSTQYNFDIGDGSTFGFMPGTTTTLRVLQASYGHYYAVRGDVKVDRYTLRCRGLDKPCWKTVKAFDGSRDCRQCVDAESVWPTKGIGWAYGGAPLNATTPGENVGAFYPSTNKLLLNLLSSIARPGPLLYTVNAEEITRRWKDSFERFWEFTAGEWRRYDGTGWRGLLSRLATLMTAFNNDGEFQLGGRDPEMPLDMIASPRDAHFELPFSASIYSRIIAPFCVELGQLQLHYLDTVSVAYIPPGAGGIYTATGKVRQNQVGDRFVSARRELLNSNKRMLVDLRQVSDPEYRAELERSGVKPSPVNQALIGSPGLEGEILKPEIKPRRAPTKPKPMRASPLAGTVRLAQRARVGRVGATAEQAADSNRTGLALGIAATGVALTSAALFGLSRLDDDRDR
jgi:hypothetical protein